MTRRAWILAAALAFAGALGLATRLMGTSQEPRRAGPQPVWVAPLALSPTATTQAARRSATRNRGHERDAASVRPAPSDASRVTRAFLAAYLPYEVGHADDATMRSLRELTTPPFWRTLTTPPRPAAKSAQTHVTQITTGATTGTHKAATVLATLRRATKAHGLAVTLIKRAGVWRVAGITR